MKGGMVPWIACAGSCVFCQVYVRFMAGLCEVAEHAEKNADPANRGTPIVTNENQHTVISLDFT